MISMQTKADILVQIWFRGLYRKLFIYLKIQIKFKYIYDFNQFITPTNL